MNSLPFLSETRAVRFDGLCGQRPDKEASSMKSVNSEPAIRVLVADDHPVVREGLTATISYQPDMTVVGKAADGREAVEVFRQQRPDVTLMDLRMPEMNGVEAIQAIRTEFPKARIIVLTTYSGDDDIYKGLHAGAVGYVLKETPMEEILEAVRTVHRGKKYVPSAVSVKLVERMSSTQLTERELEVLTLIAQGNTNQGIATALYIVEGTVKAHVANILTKLNVSDRTHAVTEALRRGILHLD
jgi:two-component system NarL family response regulator